MSESIWDEPYLPLKLGENAAVQGDREGCVTLWVEGHGVTLTNEDTARLMRGICQTQAQTDADYDQMFDNLEQQTESMSLMSKNWASLCRYWKARAEANDAEVE